MVECPILDSGSSMASSRWLEARRSIGRRLSSFWIYGVTCWITGVEVPVGVKFILMSESPNARTTPGGSGWDIVGSETSNCNKLNESLTTASVNMLTMASVCWPRTLG